MSILSAVFLSSLVVTSSSFAQSTHFPPKRYSGLKAENGLIIGWQSQLENRETAQIDVYDKEARLLASLSPLRHVPEAKRATVHDVSALPQHIIAVAVAYRKSEDTVPATSLLYYDFSGKLLLALALEPSREISCLTIDARSNVWTLTMGAGGRNPSDVPMVVVYGPTGTVVKEMLKRADFPAHAKVTLENETIGVPTLGHGADLVWFWLPGSTDLVSIKTDGFSVERTSTSLPQRSPREVPLKMVRSDSGSLLAEIMSKQDDQHRGEFGFFVRSATTKHWERFDPPCVNCLLIGADDGNALFESHSEGRVDIHEVALPN
jgi:hypothetical protein